MQGISPISADFRKSRPEKRNVFGRFRENSLRGRAGNFFGLAGNSNSLLGEKQGYFAPDMTRRPSGVFTPASPTPLAGGSGMRGIRFDQNSSFSNGKAPRAN